MGDVVKIAMKKDKAEKSVKINDNKKDGPAT